MRGIVIGVAIFILTIFVAVYGISVVFPQPQYNDFCPEVRATVIVDNIQTCESMDGKWTEYNFVKAPSEGDATGYCDLDYYCRQDFDTANEKNSKNRFLLSVPIGILIIILGSLVFKLDTVGVGLMAGGAGTFVWGAGSYWGYASDLWRFIISLLGLIFLIIFAYWFEKRKGKGLWKKIFKKKK